jgi:hypothetical protein
MNAYLIVVLFDLEKKRNKKRLLLVLLIICSISSQPKELTKRKMHEKMENCDRREQQRLECCLKKKHF